MGGRHGSPVVVGRSLVPPAVALDFAGEKGTPDAHLRFEIRDGAPECLEVVIRAKPKGRGIRSSDVEVFTRLGHASPAITWRTYAHFVPPVEHTQGRVLRGLAAIDDLLLGSTSSARIVPSKGTSGGSAQVSVPQG